MGINLLALFAPKRSSVNNQRDERQRVNVNRTNTAPLPLVSSNTQRATVAATMPLATTNVQTHTKKKAKKAENPFASVPMKKGYKLNNSEKMECFLKGAVEEKKMLGGLAVAQGLASFFPAVHLGMNLVGGAVSLAHIVYYSHKLKSCKTNEEAKKAYQQIGKGAAFLSAFTIGGLTRTATSNIVLKIAGAFFG